MSWSGWVWPSGHGNLPVKLTENLLEGRTNAIELYENPAEQVLPKVVRQGVSLLALGLSGAAETLREPLRDFREMILSKDLPSDSAVSGTALTSIQKLRGLRTYLFPPLVQFKNVAAADYVPIPVSARAPDPSP